MDDIYARPGREGGGGTRTAGGGRRFSFLMDSNSYLRMRVGLTRNIWRTLDPSPNPGSKFVFFSCFVGMIHCLRYVPHESNRPPEPPLLLCVAMNTTIQNSIPRIMTLSGTYVSHIWYLSGTKLSRNVRTVWLVPRSTC